jgi:hypothetical protein
LSFNGRISCARQRRAHGCANGIGDRGRTSKTNFSLRGMNVDVDFFQRHIDEQKRDRIDTVRQNRAVTFRHCTANQTVADEPAIDEKELRVARSAALAGRRNETFDLSNL